MIRFVWFWTFWHWSRESFRSGLLLRSPLQGIGSHWDEWFRHEASENDRRAIEETGRSVANQRKFIAWLLSHWAREANLPRNRLAPHFVLGQLAPVQPFNRWAAFDKYRLSYGGVGISAVVLAEGSAGQAPDVRLVEALVLPQDPTAPAIMPEGFQAESIDLEIPRSAAADVLHGKGFLKLLGWWLAAGERAYPLWLKTALTAGWVAVAGLILFLVAGPDPGGRLVLFSAILAGLWSTLLLIAVVSSGALAFRAWQQGRRWHAQLEQSQVRLRMDGGLTVKGGSAGVAFCLDTLLALHRADAVSTRRSWFWQRLFHQINRDAKNWAATGVINSTGHLKPVVLEPKIRACLQRDGIKHILTPRQPGTGRQVVERLAASLNALRVEVAASLPATPGVRLGFAAEEESLRIHPCRSVAHALMRVGGFISPPQIALNIFAVIVSFVMLLAAHDLRGILRPPPAPMAVAPGSPIDDCLWVSLNTRHPEYFFAVLESNYWLNRRVEISSHTGVNGSMRAEIHLRRSEAPSNNNEEDGTVWIERRHCFLSREFVPGERVGRYGFAYLYRFAHEPGF